MKRHTTSALRGVGEVGVAGTEIEQRTIGGHPPGQVSGDVPPHEPATFVVNEAGVEVAGGRGGGLGHQACAPDAMRESLVYMRGQPTQLRRQRFGVQPQ